MSPEPRDDDLRDIKYPPGQPPLRMPGDDDLRDVKYPPGQLPLRMPGGDDVRDAKHPPGQPPLRMPRRRRGFRAANPRSPPKFVWGWPLALAAIALLLVVAFLAWRTHTDLARNWEGVRLPVHPETGDLAVAALWSGGGTRTESSDEEREPVAIAIWGDGNILWSEAAQGGGGRPYRIAKLTPAATSELLLRLRKVLDTLPHRTMSRGQMGARNQQLSFRDGDAMFDVSWWPGNAPDADAVVGPVWAQAQSILLEAIPSIGQPLDVQGIRFAGSR